jgi:hypothetical protein
LLVVHRNSAAGSRQASFAIASCGNCAWPFTTAGDAFIEVGIEGVVGTADDG